MAVFDIMPYSSPHGGTTSVRWGTLTAGGGEDFDVGEPVSIVAAGTLTEPLDDTSEWLLADAADGGVGGIAAAGPAGGGQTNDRAAATNPATGLAYADGDAIPYWPVSEGTIFITQNIFTAVAAAAYVPLLTDIGNAHQISYATFNDADGNDSGWGVEQGTAGVFGTDFVAVITEVLDSLFRPIRDSGQAGVHILFTIHGRGV